MMITIRYPGGDVIMVPCYRVLYLRRPESTNGAAVVLDAERLAEIPVTEDQFADISLDFQRYLATRRERS